MATFKYNFKTNQSLITQGHAKYLGNVHEAIMNRLMYIGERFVKNARSKTGKQGGFNDVTGNLRSSIGYMILYNGTVLEENFVLAKKGNQGLKEGKSLTSKIAAEFHTGFSLIVVAGMNYAAAVENLHHKDVITGSSHIAEKELKEGFSKLKKKLNL